MKLTDYVVDFLEKEGVKYVFGLTGGAVVHLFDSLDKNTNITPVFTHHEQAAAFAAEAYARVRNDLGVACVTTGPGGTNAITGVLAAWTDSIPCIYISGQSRIEHTSQNKPIRQLGSQEFDIVSLVSHITKYAIMIDDPKLIKYHLQKAVYLAKNGRPGPVWIDIPLNFQWISVNPDELPEFNPLSIEDEKLPEESVDDMVQECCNLLSIAKRPLVLAGHGIRLAHAEEEFKKFVLENKIPFVSSWNASDLLSTDNGFYAGRIGVAGQRGGNLAIQNCDVLLILGSHLSINITSANYHAFAREAKKIIVDIDPVELANCNIKVDLSIRCNCKVFLQKLLNKFDKRQLRHINLWHEKCSKYKSYNAIPLQWRKQKKHINPYVFVDALSNELNSEDAIVVDGGGTALYMSFQALRIKQGQRLIVSAAIASMGTGLPESIGACFANNFKRTICMIGDGSIQLNIQELQTLVHHNLNIKIFVFNNCGYLAIRHTQDGFLDKRHIGSSKNGGISLPDFQKVAKAYGLKTVCVYNNKELTEKIKLVLNEPGPVLCEIMISPEQELIPRMGFETKSDGTSIAKPLEDMAPYLDRKVFLENMVVKTWDEFKKEKEVSE